MNSGRACGRAPKGGWEAVRGEGLAAGPAGVLGGQDRVAVGLWPGLGGCGRVAMAVSGSPQRPPGGDKMAAGPGPVRAEPGEGQIPARWGPRTGPPVLWAQSSGRARDPRCDAAQPVPFLFAPWDAAPVGPQRSPPGPHRFLAFLPRQRRSTQTLKALGVFLPVACFLPLS